ncbi:hypothetical protein BGZ96_004493 [Linnemannia gamsii]|uniref:deoxyhypusine synthase n=1 Tax=Linnemannia gamsii TaxID=64522 RepID=A0ABQ7JI32_9FUNG|nr:hypothetical protein BGZ96_004493 [Linnemannia gamsii]
MPICSSARSSGTVEQTMRCSLIRYRSLTDAMQGPRPDEAVSWGKIRLDGKSVKVYADATITFPLIVSQTFAKDVKKTERDSS